MKISVIVPVYNEEEIIADTAQRLHGYMLERFGEGQFEILFSDDGSDDESFKKLSQLPLSGIRVIGTPENRGKGYAVRNAMMQAAGDIALFTDADLAYGVDVIGEFYDRSLKEPDTHVFIGSRNLCENGYAGYTFFRKFASKTYIGLLRKVCGIKLSDFQCGCKAFTRTAREKIFGVCRSNGFSFDLEVLLLAKKLGYGIRELPVKVIKHKGSKIRIISDSLRMLLDIGKIKKRINALNIEDDVSRERR